MDTHHDIETWQAATAGKRQVFNFNYRMTGDELRGWQLVNTVVMQERPGASERIYIWEKSGSHGKALLRVGLVELEDTRTAMLVLQDTLRHTMRPDLPAAPKALARSADVAFASQAEGSKQVASVNFTLGNLAVTVASVGETEVDVSGVVTLLGKLLGAAPSSESLKQGTARSLFEEPAKAGSRGAGRLVEELPEVEQGVWVKVLATAGRLRREGRSLVYEAPESGAQQVEGFAVKQQ
jgi:hypothetical protein